MRRGIDLDQVVGDARGVENRVRSGPGADVQRRYAKKVARKAKARERRLGRQIEGANQIEKPVRTWGLRLTDLRRDSIGDARTAVEARSLRTGYGGHQVLRGVDLFIRGEDRVALLGENGSGKSTLLRCLTGRHPFSGLLRLGPSIRLGYLAQESDDLSNDRTVLEIFRSATEMREDEARTYLHKFLFSGDEVFKSPGALSYGQRAKLSLAMLIASGANFLLLDEPTSHMDMRALEDIEHALESYPGPLLLISHDRYFIERIGVTRILVMQNGRLHVVESLAAYEAELGWELHV